MNFIQKNSTHRMVLAATCLIIIGVFGSMIDLKGISTDEGVRLWIISGGNPAQVDGAMSGPGWAQVLKAVEPLAYQPLYFLLQNSIMRLTQDQSLQTFRMLNLGFLALCLWGLLNLARNWRIGQTLFALIIFAGNAFLIMHVLQIREYIAGVAFYIWSTWLVLRLDKRRLTSPWSDTVWFSVYGFLLTVGFYLQSWIVFPAIAQGLFLLLRRRENIWRFRAHLALAYAIVVTTTLPYLQTHTQKANIGLWATENATLGSHLSTGLHLVLTGQLPASHGFSDCLLWIWLAFLFGTGVLLYRQSSHALADVPISDFKRQAWLMTLCIVVSLAFQIGYYYHVENLSLWPRYFIIHYFFVIWLISLAFKYLDDLRRAPNASIKLRRSLAIVITGITFTALSSAIWQIERYRSDPYFDTSLSWSSDWRVGVAILKPVLHPDDVILCQDFITRATLSFTQPQTNRMLLLEDLDHASLEKTQRLVYLFPTVNLPQLPPLVERLKNLGFTRQQELAASSLVRPSDTGQWVVFAFERQ